VKTHQTDRRSKRTHKLLNDALLTLLSEKRYELITVEDIIRRADVGRSTFYAHYQDKEDLLISSFQHMLDIMSQQLKQVATRDQRLLPALELFQHVQSHRYLYKAIVGGRGLELLSRQGKAYFSRSIAGQLKIVAADSRTSIVPAGIIADYVASSFLTLLTWWLDNNLPYSPERMADMFQQLVMQGVQAAIGSGM
jgi:AcrR family transcriptional regulator